MPHNGGKRGFILLPTELENLVRDIIAQKCERQNIELKCAGRGTPEKLYDTLSSFSNQAGGGIILFGIDEKNNFEITGVYDAQDLQAKVAAQALQMEPVVRPVFTVAEMNGRIVVSAEISECDIFDKPCFYKGAGRIRGSYVRVGEADMPMTEYEVYSYEVFRRKIQDELRTVERADMEAFDQNALAEYFIRLRKMKPNLSRQPDEKILQLQGIVDKGKPTVAGIMLFGEYPQAFFPQLSVTAVVVDGTEIGEPGENGERFIDNQRMEGTISQMLEETLTFIRRNIRTATIVDKEGNRTDRTEYPMLAVREIVLNALIHRDYSIHTDHSPVRVILYRDRLEVENPGGLYGRITVDELGKMAADTRNPFIAGALEVMLGTENRFSGIPTIMHEMKKAGLPPAVFESKRGVFKVTLYNGYHSENNIMATEEPLPGPVQKLLEYCRVPRSRNEIADHMGIGTPSYVVKKYVRPLLETGVLRMTIPDAPKSKNQKYVIAKETIHE